MDRPRRGGERDLWQDGFDNDAPFLLAGATVLRKLIASAISVKSNEPCVDSFACTASLET